LLGITRTDVARSDPAATACAGAPAHQTFLRIAIVSTRRSQFTQHDRSLTPLAAGAEVAQVGDLAPVLEGSALIVAPELRRAFSAAQSASVSVTPTFQSAEHASEY
jgi:hypothetical protein